MLVCRMALWWIDKHITKICQPKLAIIRTNFKTSFPIISKIGQKPFVALYGTWGPLGVGRILARGVGTICPPGDHHSDKNSLNFFNAVRAMPG